MQEQRRHGLSSRRYSSSGGQHKAATSFEAPHEARRQAANSTEEAANALTPLSLTPPVDDPLAALQLKMDQLVQGYLYLSENNQRLEKTVS